MKRTFLFTGLAAVALSTTAMVSHAELKVMDDISLRDVSGQALTLPKVQLPNIHLGPTDYHFNIDLSGGLNQGNKTGGLGVTGTAAVNVITLDTSGLINLHNGQGSKNVLAYSFNGGPAQLSTLLLTSANGTKQILQLNIGGPIYLLMNRK